MRAETGVLYRILELALAQHQEIALDEGQYGLKDPTSQDIGVLLKNHIIVCTHAMV